MAWGHIDYLIAALEDRADRARRYQQMRREMPTEPARRIFGYITDDEACGTYRQWSCRHEWSSGHDPDTDREVGIYCLNCGMAEG